MYDDIRTVIELFTETQKMTEALIYRMEEEGRTEKSLYTNSGKIMFYSFLEAVDYNQSTEIYTNVPRSYIVYTPIITPESFETKEQFKFVYGDDVIFNRDILPSKSEHKICISPDRGEDIDLYYNSAFEIPEEELFQKNTKYSDYELCLYYIFKMFHHSGSYMNLCMSVNIPTQNVEVLRKFLLDLRESVLELQEYCERVQ